MFHIYRGLQLYTQTCGHDWNNFIFCRPKKQNLKSILFVNYFIMEGPSLIIQNIVSEERQSMYIIQSTFLDSH